ncbi:MAG: hypothetical protein ACKO24_01880 [Leptolyngbyaceae cyanobacterium]
MDFEDLTEMLSEYKTLLLIGACGLVGAANLLTGGGQQLQAKFSQNAADSALNDRQFRAESLFQEQGCIAQAVSINGTSNFVVGDVAIDPVSITATNPQGSPINSGLICSSDGSLFTVEDGKVTELIGTSPKIRQFLVKEGFADEAKRMQRKAQQQGGV